MKRSGSNLFVFNILGIWLLAGFMPLYGQTSGPWLTYEGKSGPGKGKYIVLISGDEEIALKKHYQ